MKDTVCCMLKPYAETHRLESAQVPLGHGAVATAREHCVWLSARLKAVNRTAMPNETGYVHDPR
jgi:hypothetical protein